MTLRIKVLWSLLALRLLFCCDTLYLQGVYGCCVRVHVCMCARISGIVLKQDGCERG